ncbi:hypothetical protein E2C01_030197 [Portunus trituberculatus]|uniref:Uncharacterized protein n=1 Tax=Portunus trituberculatus TaxID=210409 RepID=A0A5B7EU19_PORTR|nr:hypothetical protein [Portunus trituberculatus]
MHLNPLIQSLADDRSELFDSIDHHEEDGDAGVVLMFHHIDLLGTQEGGEAQTQHWIPASSSHGLVLYEYRPLCFNSVSRKYCDQHRA